jgi:hypothetical protein
MCHVTDCNTLDGAGVNHSTGKLPNAGGGQPQSEDIMVMW